MRPLSPRPLLVLGALVACAATRGRARAEGPAADAWRSRPRTAQAGPSADSPLGRPRTDQAPGNDAPSGLPRPSTAPIDPARDPARTNGPSGTTPPANDGQPRVAPAPPAGASPRPAAPAAARPPAPADAAPAPADAPAPTGDAGAKAAEGGAAPPNATAPAWRAELASDRFLRKHPLRPPLLEIGPSLVYESRRTRGGGPSYEDALAPSLSLRARLRSWLIVGIRYRAVAHALDLPPNSFGLEGDSFDDTRRTYVRSLDGYVHPTLHPFDWLRVWGTVGLGWGQITMPPILVTSRPDGSTLRPRTGVFADVPLGLGAAYQTPLRWLTVSAEGLFEPVFYQDGNMYQTTRYLNRGAFADAQPMPRLRHSISAIVGFSFAL